MSESYRLGADIGGTFTDLVLEMLEESPFYRGLPKDHSTISNNLQECAENGILLTALSGPQIVGYLAGLAVPMEIHSDQLMTVERGLYVKPEYRQHGLAKQLLDTYERWASAIGATLITLGVTTEIDPERTYRFYERLGYHNSGRVFTKKVPTCVEDSSL